MFLVILRNLLILFAGLTTTGQSLSSGTSSGNCNDNVYFVYLQLHVLTNCFMSKERSDRGVHSERITKIMDSTVLSHHDLAQYFLTS